MTTQSLRKQAREDAKRNERDERRREARATAIEMLRQGKTYREIERTSGVSIATVARLKKAMSTPGGLSLDKFLQPHQNRAGAKPVLTREEEQLIKQKMVECAQRGFAMDVRELTRIMGAIAGDGRRRGFKNGIPTGDVIRSFRARNRDITLRTFENKENAKLKGENYEDVKTYADALERIAAANDGIFDSGDRFWNLDETKVDGEFGHKTKVFGSSGTHHGGFRASATSAGSGKHLTAVVVASASGRKLPPFFVFAGKNVMSNWFDPLRGDQYCDESGNPHWFATGGWFPADAALFPTENGSMEKRVIPFVVDHVHRHVRKVLGPTVKFVLSLDGHSSRNGYDWLESCNAKGIEVVQSPANTSHFLQPCDSYINKTFQSTVRTVRDEICAVEVQDVKSMGFKLKLGVAGFRALSEGIIQASFTTLGLWPMDYRFLQKFRTEEATQRERLNALKSRVASSKGCGGRLAVLNRHADTSTLRDITNVISQGLKPSTTIDRLSKILSERKTVHGILSSVAAPQRSTVGRNKRVEAPNADKATKTALMCGMPALYLTHGDLIKHRKDREAKESAEK